MRVKKEPEGTPGMAAEKKPGRKAQAGQGTLSGAEGAASRVSAAERERFAALCAGELPEVASGEDNEAGINIFGEKRMHAVLKNFYCPDVSRHEIRLTDDRCRGHYRELTDAAGRREASRYIADILTADGEIIEIQTGGLYPLVKKLHFYLCATDCRVSVVHPIAAARKLRWMDPHTGELSPGRTSPRRGSVRDIARELYWIAPYLAEPRFSLRVPLLAVEETRLRDGWGNGGKRGSHRYVNIPTAILDEWVFACPQDYATVFLPPPDALPSPFTAVQYAAASGVRGMATYSLLRILGDLGFVAPAEKQGRAGRWTRV